MRKVTESNEGHELQEYIQLRAHVRGRHKRDHTTAKPELYVKIVMKTFDYTHISTDDDDHEEGRGDQGRVPT